MEQLQSSGSPTPAPSHSISQLKHLSPKPSLILYASQSHSVPPRLLLFQTFWWLKWPFCCRRFIVSSLWDCQTCAHWRLNRWIGCVICSFYSDPLFGSLFRKNKGVCWVFTHYRSFQLCFKLPTFRVAQDLEQSYCRYWIKSCLSRHQTLTSFSPPTTFFSVRNTDLISVHWLSWCLNLVSNRESCS